MVSGIHIWNVHFLCKRWLEFNWNDLTPLFTQALLLQQHHMKATLFFNVVLQSSENECHRHGKSIAFIMMALQMESLCKIGLYLMNEWRLMATFAFPPPGLCLALSNDPTLLLALVLKFTFSSYICKSSCHTHHVT